MKNVLSTIYLICMHQLIFCSQKRQFINPVKIDRWSGPFFSQDEQQNAFDKLVSGDMTGSKRMDLGGIDPDKILNPEPEKPHSVPIKNEGPVAETYLGKNPEADKMVLISPQERLAHLISKPIIQEEYSPLNYRHVHNYHHPHDQPERILQLRRYMFHRHEDDNDERFGDDQRRHFDNNEREEKLRDAKRTDEEEYDKQRGDLNEHERNSSDNENDEYRHNEKRSHIKHAKKKSKIHNKTKHNTGKKSDLAPIDNHIPELMMVGGIPDPSTNMAHHELPNNENTLTNLNGDSDVPLAEDDPIPLTGIGVNSHSDVQEIAKEMGSAEEMHPQVNPDASIQVPTGDTLTEKLMKGEATFHSTEDSAYENVGLPQGKEPIDQHTIYVHHHNGKSTGPEEARDKPNTRRSFAKKPKIVRSNILKHGRTSKNPQLGKVIISPAKKTIPEENAKTKRWGDSTEHQGGFREDNAAAEFNSRLGGGHLHLMTIGERDGSDIHKEWNNMHSPGNGYYIGAGLGPARSMEGEYIHHNSHYALPFHSGHGFPIHDDHTVGQGFGAEYAGIEPGHMFSVGHRMSGGYGSHGDISGGFGGRGMMGGYEGHGMFGEHGRHGMFGGYGRHEMFGRHGVHGMSAGYGGHEGNDDPLHSLAGSNSRSDHETAGLIDAIWEHDYGGEHVDRGHHNGKDGVLSFFGHTDSSALLPTERMDGFEDHWSDHNGFHGAHWSGGIGEPIVHNSEAQHGHSRIGAIQDIQDDPSIDSELQTEGIGMEMGGHHAHHHMLRHGHHGVGMPFMEQHDVGNYGDHLHGGHNEVHDEEHDRDHDDGTFAEHPPMTPVDVPHHQEMSPDEYHNHIDSLMLKYHQLEEDMRGQHGTLMDHLDEHLLNHHGQPQYHSGYDLYAYKNPFENAELPYHVPVENHPDSSEPKEQVGGGSMEQGGKGDGKGEEKGGPLVEAKKESKPPPKKEEKKKEDKKPPEIHKAPDWTGMPPKVPNQRGGPEQSGSLELTVNEKLAPAVPEGTSEISSLLQAISAYRAMNLSVPASLQIQELKEELKEAKAETKTSAEAAGIIPSPKPPLPSNTQHEIAETKNKSPDKQADTPNGAAEVTNLIQDMGSKSASYNPQTIPQFQRLQQLNFVQQALLKQMLVNVVEATKEREKPVEKEDKEQATVEDILNIGHERDNSVKQQQLLALLQNMQKNGAASTTFNNLANAVQTTSNFVKQSDTPSVNPDSKSMGADQNAAIATMVKSENLKIEDKENEAMKAELLKSDKNLSTLTPAVVPSLDVPSNEQNTNVEDKGNNDSDLVKLLTSAVLSKQTRKHNKKKHTNSAESAYAKIGYEQASDSEGFKTGSKKDISSASVLVPNSIASLRVTPNTLLKNYNPVESPTSEDEDTTSKKTKIKSVKAKLV